MTNARKSKYDLSINERTYASLRIYHKSKDPNRVTQILHINPDWTVKVGEKIVLKRRATHSSWCITTKDVLSKQYSRNIRFHIEYLLKKILRKKVEIKNLIAAGFKIAIFVFIGSSSSNVEYLLDQKFIKRLSEFPIEIYFDIYFNEE